jgi:hypothetical protein
MEFQSVDYTIDTLLQRIRTSRLALPDFQREFVWKPNEVVELLDSVARQWPIGSLLLLSGPQPFATKEIESGPKVSETDLDSYILDGQQRITSLYHAVMDVSEYCYYINFSELEAQSDDYIHWERRDRFMKQYPTIETRAANEIALIKEVWDSQSFFRWTECLSNDQKRYKFVTARDIHLGGLQTKVYKIMAIELQQEISLEALARIFETLNRTGVRLNAFDLMVAALYPSGFKLKEEWDFALSNYPILNRIKPDAIEILKLCALRIRYNEGKSASAGVRQGDLLKIERRLIIDYWQSSLVLYTKALMYCKSNFGIQTTELMPSWSLILGVAGLLENGPTDKTIIHKWWMHRILHQHFSQAANTRVVSDFENSHANAISNFEISPEDLIVLLEPTKKNGLLAKAFAGLLINSGAADLLTGNVFSDSDRVVFRSVREGVTYRMDQSSDLLETIIVTEQTDRILGKQAALDNYTEAATALMTQGFAINSMKREDSFLMKLFSKSTQE